MDANTVPTRPARLAMVALAALAVALVAALAMAPQEAQAHQTKGRTLVYIDGELVKSTKDEHFTVRRTLSRGCHTAQVLYKREGRVVSRTDYRGCGNSPFRLTIEVDDGGVSFRKTSTTTTAGDTDGSTEEPAA